MKFEYFVDLKEGYKKVLEVEPTEQIRFIVESENRVTADRAVKALLTNATNIKKCLGICIED